MLNLSRTISKFVAWQVVCLMKNEHQSQNLLLKVDPRSTFRNNFLQPAANRIKDQQTFVARHVDHTSWKTRNIDLKLATKQCCATRWRFLYLVFRHLYSRVGRWRTDSLLRLPFILAFSGFWYLVFRRLKLDISQWANFVIASEQTLSSPVSKQQSKQYLQYSHQN